MPAIVVQRDSTPGRAGTPRSTRSARAGRLAPSSNREDPAPRSSDAELLRRCVSGDAAAWDLLVSRYKALVYGVALDTGLAPDDACDVFQEVWIELHRSAGRIEKPSALPRWLMVATRRICYKVAARRRRMVPGISANWVDPGSLPDDAVAAAHARLRLEAALDEVGGKCAQLLRNLFFRQPELSYEQIAEAMGWKIGSIGPIRSRCLARLRAVLETRTKGGS